MNEHVILVNELDDPTGLAPKEEAHRKGLLHRAISVFIVNENNELLIQQRAEGKYHSGGQWANTCCSHPRAGESTLQAAERRLQEEMGIQTSLEHAFSHIYDLEVSEEMREHEYDHVFFGISNVEPKPHPEEVQAWKYMPWKEISVQLKTFPSLYSPWFHEIFPKAAEKFGTFLKNKVQPLNNAQENNVS